MRGTRQSGFCRVPAQGALGKVEIKNTKSPPAQPPRPQPPARSPAPTPAAAAPTPAAAAPSPANRRRRRAPLRPSSSSSISPSRRGVPSRRQALAAHDGVPRLRRGPAHGPRWCSSPATAPRERASPVAAGVAALWRSLLTLRPSAPQLLTCYSKP